VIIITTVNQRVSSTERHKICSSNFIHLTPKSCHTERLCQHPLSVSFGSSNISNSIDLLTRSVALFRSLLPSCHHSVPCILVGLSQNTGETDASFTSNQLKICSMVRQDYTVDTVVIGVEKLSLVSACK
jgi:hypothetical protein